MTFLSKEFLDKFPTQPEHMNELASFVFYRTYSRWLPSLKRRETFKEAIARAVDYNIGIGFKHTMSLGYDNETSMKESAVQEAEVLFESIFNLNQFLSGRTHWVGGAETHVADKFPLSNFNCAFVEPKIWSDFGQIFYLLLVGTGVGIRLSKENVANLEPVRTDFELTHSEFHPLPKEERIETTTLKLLDNGYAKIYVGDSKEGWVEAFNAFFKLITMKQYSYIKHIKISYNSIRPKGERLKTFGGRASGHEPLMAMFSKINLAIRGELDSSLAPLEQTEDKHNILRPIHCMDIANLMGANVVVGGVRRTAEIVLCDEDDSEIISAKRDYWLNPSLSHRAMSNNSIIFEDQPTKEKLIGIIENIKKNGEPGFFNFKTAKKRRPGARGVNPCGEIILDNKGVCNLTTIVVTAFIREVNGVPVLDAGRLARAQRLSVRAGLRMTTLDLELPDWDTVHKRDRLVGCSVTGWRDAMEMLGYDEEKETELMNYLEQIAISEAQGYSTFLRISNPLLITTVKPEGTLSQVANGVSSGIHASFAPFYIRRVRINADDPLAKVAFALNWRISPEVDTEGDSYDEQMKNAKTLVVDFPVKSGATKTSDEQTAKEQFENYLRFQRSYTEHNTSVTIYVKDHEWEEITDMIYDNWDEFVGVALLPHHGGDYQLAPYEKITEEAYEALKLQMEPFNIDLLNFIEENETEKDVENMTSCDTGSCPIW